MRDVQCFDSRPYPWLGAGLSGRFPGAPRTLTNVAGTVMREAFEEALNDVLRPMRIPHPEAVLGRKAS